jgi:HEAT repeat protein
VRCRAAVALGRLKDDRAIEPLHWALKASNWQLFRHSFHAIVKFGESAIPALNKYSAMKARARSSAILCSMLWALSVRKSSMFSLLQEAV